MENIFSSHNKMPGFFNRMLSTATSALKKIVAPVSAAYHWFKPKEAPKVVDHSRIVKKPKYKNLKGGVMQNAYGEEQFKDIGIALSKEEQKRHTQHRVALRDVEAILIRKMFERYDSVIAKNSNRMVDISGYSIRFNKAKMLENGVIGDIRDDGSIMVSTSKYQITTRQQISKYVKEITNDLIERVSDFETNNGSGWIFYSLINVMIKTGIYPLGRGGEYINVPNIQKRGVLNIKNTDNRCLLYCLAASNHPELYNAKTRATNPKQYEKFFSEYKLPPGIEEEFKVGIDPNSHWIDELEELNNLVICIYGTKCKSPRKEAIANDSQMYIRIKFREVGDTRRLVNLVYITKRDKETDVLHHHYALIRPCCADGALGLAKFTSAFSTDDHYAQMCPYCYARFRPPYKLMKKGKKGQPAMQIEVDKLADHIKQGCKKRLTNLSFSPQGVVDKFNRTDTMALHPYVAYLDHEAHSFIIETNALKEAKFKHVPKEFHMIFIDTNQTDITKKCIKEIYYKGPPCIAKGLHEARKYTKFLIEKIKTTDVGRNKTPQEQDQMKKEAKVCYLCQKDFFKYLSRTEEENLLKTNTKAYIQYRKDEISKAPVIDHDHITGEVYGVAHSSCNLWRSNHAIKIPVIGHNLMGYDNHPIILELADQVVEDRLTINDCKKKSALDMVAWELNDGKISEEKAKSTANNISKTKHSSADNIEVVAKTNEKYMSISVYGMKFTDSYLHIHAPLQSIIDQSKPKKNSPIEAYKEEFPLFYNYLSSINKVEHIEKLSGKLPMPYNYYKEGMDEEEDFFPKEAFENYMHKGKVYKLGALDPTLENVEKETHGDTTDQIYEEAKKLYYEDLKCKNKGEYFEIYCKSDVYQLADVFENYRKAAFEKYGIDPVFYVSNPAFAYAALKKVTQQPISLPYDEEMFNFVRHNVRGGLSLARTKWGKPKMFYGDLNSMYWLIQNSYMPTGEMWWAPDEDLPKDLNEWMEYVKDYPIDTDIGFFPEVDLECPLELHRKFYKFPLAPTSEVIKPHRLNQDYQLKLKHLCGINSSDSQKLTVTLEPKKAYGLDYQTLQFYLRQGYKVTKVHRILMYKQSPWMRPFVQLNLENRKKATRQGKKFLANVFKITGHSGAFGKFIERTFDHDDSSLICSEQITERMMQRMRFKLKGYHVFPNGKLAIRNNHRKDATVDRNPLIGAVILDRAKMEIYKYAYKFFEKFPQCELNYTDTDSLVIGNLPDDFRMQIKNDPEFYDMFDFSNYPKDHPLYSDHNFMELGKMKDECASKEILNAIFLCAKSYWMILEDHTAKKAGKGVSKEVLLDQLLTYQDYYDVYKMSSFKKVQAYFIRAKDHVNITEPLTKVGLTSYDDKLYCINRDLCVPYGTDPNLVAELQSNQLKNCL